MIHGILLAEFDIEKGSTLSCSYPNADSITRNNNNEKDDNLDWSDSEGLCAEGSTPTTSSSSSSNHQSYGAILETVKDKPEILAEIMLPDGAHLRELDWTYFFLSKKNAKDELFEGGLDDEPVRLQANCIYEYQSQEAVPWKKLANSNNCSVCLEGEFFTFCKKRLHITQNISFGKRPSSHMTGMNGSFVYVIGNNQAFCFDFGKFNDTEMTFLYYLERLCALAQKRKELRPSIQHKERLYALNLVRTKQIPGVKRNARTKAMAIVSDEPFIHVYKPLLMLALDHFFTEPEDPEKILRWLFHTIEDRAIDKRIGNFSLVEKIIMRLDRHQQTIVSGKDSRILEDVIKFLGVPVPIKIPLYLYPEEIGDFSVVKLVQTFNYVDKTTGLHAFMLLLNAVIAEKRILFLGHTVPSGQLCAAVLATASLCAPILSGFPQRTFPYTNLSQVDELIIQRGYIAGVNNPIFQHNEEWWDLLCNLDTGKITVSSKIRQGLPLNEEANFVPLFATVQKLPSIECLDPNYSASSSSSPLTSPSAAMELHSPLSRNRSISSSSSSGGKNNFFQAMSKGFKRTISISKKGLSLSNSSRSLLFAKKTTLNNSNSSSEGGSNSSSSCSTGTYYTSMEEGSESSYVMLSIPIPTPEKEVTLDPLQALIAFDNEFMNRLISSVDNHMGELFIRHQFQCFVKRMVDIGFHNNSNFALTSPLCDKAKQREISAHRFRVESWKRTSSFEFYRQAQLHRLIHRNRKSSSEEAAVSSPDCQSPGSITSSPCTTASPTTPRKSHALITRKLESICFRLKHNLAANDPKALVVMYEELMEIVDTEEMALLLVANFIEEPGSLTPLAYHITNSDGKVRQRVREFLLHLRKFNIGKREVSRLEGADELASSLIKLKIICPKPPSSQSRR